MKTRLAAAAILAVAFGSRALAQDTSSRIYQIASMLSGTYEGSTPGNHLTLSLIHI